MKCWELLPAYLIHLRADPLGSISLKVVPLCQLPFSVSDLCIMLTLPWYQEVDELEVVVGGRGRNRWGIKQNRKWVTVHSQDCCWGRLAVQSWQSPAVLQQMQVHLQSEMVWSRSWITKSKPNIETGVRFFYLQEEDCLWILAPLERAEWREHSENSTAVAIIRGYH